MDCRNIQYDWLKGLETFYLHHYILYSYVISHCVIYNSSCFYYRCKNLIQRHLPTNLHLQQSKFPDDVFFFLISCGIMCILSTCQATPFMNRHQYVFFYALGNSKEPIMIYRFWNNNTLFMSLGRLSNVRNHLWRFGKYSLCDYHGCIYLRKSSLAHA